MWSRRALLAVVLACAGCGPEPHARPPMLPTVFELSLPSLNDWSYGGLLVVPMDYVPHRYEESWAWGRSLSGRRGVNDTLGKPAVTLRLFDSFSRDKANSYQEVLHPCGTDWPAWWIPLPDGYQVLCARLGKVTRFIRVDEGVLRCSVDSLDGHPAEVIGEAWRICASVSVSWVRDARRAMIAEGDPLPPRYRRVLRHAVFSNGWSGWSTHSTIVPMTLAQMASWRLELIERGEAMMPSLPGRWLGPGTLRDAERQDQRNMRYWRELSRAVKGLPPSREDPWAPFVEWPPSRRFPRERAYGATYDEPDR